MATPRHRFRAHYGSPLALAQSDKGGESSRKRLGLHIVGVAAKAEVAPTCVGRILPRMSQTTQEWHRNILDVLCLQDCGKDVAVELRVMARTRDCPNVAKTFDPILSEQSQEAFDGQV